MMQVKQDIIVEPFWKSLTGLLCVVLTVLFWSALGYAVFAP